MSIAAKTSSAQETNENTLELRLIDQGTLGLESSVSGRAERYGRGKTSHTIHVWWARRPHAAMRALVFASLCKETGAKAKDLMRDIALALDIEDQSINEARSLIRHSYESPPKVLDMFGGGGTIPYEAALLGAKAYSLDYNPLSVFIQKSNLEFSQLALNYLEHAHLLQLIEEAGKSVIEILTKRTEDLYPLRNKDHQKGNTFAYFWSYKKKCNGCGFEFYLSKRPWLSRKGGRKTLFKFISSDNHEYVAISEASDNASPHTHWVGRNGTAECPKCGQSFKNPSIKECSDELMALGLLKKSRGKEFYSPVNEAVPSDTYLSQRETDLIKLLDVSIPETQLPRWSGIVNPALYGVETHSDFLNKRQRVVLLELIASLRKEYESLLQKYHINVCNYILSVLSGLIDQMVDWNCRLSMWISQNEQVGRAFCGPGVSMLWDYVETDPVLKGPANLWDKLDRILSGTRNFVPFEEKPNILNGSSQKMSYDSGFFDAIVTDPPYYDNLYYNVLADFFYAWKRVLLRKILPDLFEEEKSGEEQELVASKIRRGDSEEAHRWYCEQLTMTLREACRALKPNGVLSFVYGHSSLKGWEAIVRAFRDSGFRIDAVEPLSIERKQRPRAMTSEAVNTCIVLVARKESGLKKSIQLQTVIDSVQHEVATFGAQLRGCGWSTEDIGMAIFARGVALLANALKVESVSSDIEALAKIGLCIGKAFPEFKMQNRSSI
jgi:putative DNA methylase